MVQIRKSFYDRSIKKVRSLPGRGMWGLFRGFSGAAVALLLLPGCGGSGSEVDFNRDIRPVLNESCVGCHGGVHRESELSLLFLEDALTPAESGNPAVVPGDPDASELMRRITHADPSQRMPAESPSLTRAEIDRFREWIRAGAEWTPHWAYVAPAAAAASAIPSVQDASWPRNEIDFFILSRLEEEDMNPSPQAECAVLARRVSMDLTGLPPSIEDVDGLCADLESRYAAYVDTLLARPAFGERWAAMWLDLARYADSQGYEADHYRSIWRYRDWVIDAFNADMPFDRFTIEQLAGDLLPETEPSRLVASNLGPYADTSRLIASAFHRNAMTNTEGGTDDEEHRYAAVIDRVNTTWEVWQGTSFGCAQCHGHPYDPFRQEEYYSALAFFNNTADWDQTDERPVLYEFSQDGKERGADLLDRLKRIDDDIMAAVRSAEGIERRRAWEARLGEQEVVGQVLNTRQNKLLRIVKIPEPERSGRQQAVVETIYADVAERIKPLRDRRDALKREIAGLEPVTTPVMRELPPEESRRTPVFERGNFLVPLQEVAPDVPASMPPLPDGAPRNRLGLAEWLVSAENPLTARVFVNHLWAQLFGIGIVETLEDFGTQGTPPTHPELLDWLAVTFRDADGWSVKSMLRRIALSATYRQSSVVNEEALERDPRNLLLARSPRIRLTAEQLRDEALAASGLLSEKMHGPSVMPYQPDGIWQNPYSGATWETESGDERYRRALYTYWRRTAPYPAMVTFDSPSREFCVSRRTRTNTPLQALVALNDPAFFEAAQALGRVMAQAIDSPDPAADASVENAITHGFRRALARRPNEEELSTLAGLFASSLADFAADPIAARAMLEDPAMPDSSSVVEAYASPPGDYASDSRAPAPNNDTEALSADRAARLAALTVVANAIMNLDEFITRG